MLRHPLQRVRRLSDPRSLESGIAKGACIANGPWRCLSQRGMETLQHSSTTPTPAPVPSPVTANEIVNEVSVGNRAKKLWESMVAENFAGVSHRKLQIFASQRGLPAQLVSRPTLIAALKNCDASVVAEREYVARGTGSTKRLIPAVDMLSPLDPALRKKENLNQYILQYFKDRLEMPSPDPKLSMFKVACDQVKKPAVTEPGLEEIILDLLEDKIPLDKLQQIVEDGVVQMKDSPNVVRLSGQSNMLGVKMKYNVVSSLNGDFSHLLHLFSESVTGFPSSTNRYIFLGNICAPPGSHDIDSLRCLLALISAQMLCPESVTMLLGENELRRRMGVSATDSIIDPRKFARPRKLNNGSYRLPAPYTLPKTKAKAPSELQKRIIQLITHLPLAAVVADTAFLCHRPDKSLLLRPLDEVETLVQNRASCLNVSATSDQNLELRTLLPKLMSFTVGRAPGPYHASAFWRQNKFAVVYASEPRATESHSWHTRNRLLAVTSHSMRKVHVDKPLACAVLCEGKIEITEFLPLGGSVDRAEGGSGLLAPRRQTAAVGSEQMTGDSRRERWLESLQGEKGRVALAGAMEEVDRYEVEEEDEDEDDEDEDEDEVEVLDNADLDSTISVEVSDDLETEEWDDLLEEDEFFGEGIEREHRR